MNRTRYCECMKQLAHEKRAKHFIRGFRMGISDIRRIYKDEGVVYDLAPNKNCPFDFKKIQGAYMNDDDGPCILINKHLPKDPRVFTMAHELKHHYVDADTGRIICSGKEDSQVEISANVFAAEFILPDQLFLAGMTAIGCRYPCTPDDLVRFKIGSETSLSYQGLVKKALWLGVGKHELLAKVKYHNLAEQLYGGYADASRLRMKEDVGLQLAGIDETACSRSACNPR